MKFSNIALGSLLILSASVVSANPININGVEFVTGANLQTGTQFYAVEDDGGEGIGQGIGEIQQITDDLGNVVWQDGDNGTDLWFVFDNLDILPTFSTPFGDIVATTGGSIQFYTTASDSFDPNSGTFAGDVASLTGMGDLWLDTLLTSVDSGNGIFTTLALDAGASGNSLVGTGWLDVTGGAAGSFFDTGTIANDFDGQLSDLQWGFSVTTDISFDEYQYTGSSDFRSFAVPVPATALLFGLGMIGMVGARKFFG